MSEELKPCLLCGAPVLLCEDPQERSMEMIGVGAESWEFVCTNGECPFIPCIIATSRAEAITAWNSRPGDSVMELAQKVADAMRKSDSPEATYEDILDVARHARALAAALPRKS